MYQEMEFLKIPFKKFYLNLKVGITLLVFR